MILGAMVDAGLAVEKLRAELSRLPLDGYVLDTQTVNRRGIRGTQVSVTAVASQPERPRHLPDILRLIDQSSLSEKAKRTSVAIFHRLARAEAAVHGVSTEDVHFHEVGAVDAIVDIVGAAIGIEQLGIDRAYASAIPTGYGITQAAHGAIPIPGPAVLELLKGSAATVYQGRIEAELTTPTGAAVLTTIATFETPRMSVQAVGYGFGRKELPWPNALRLWLGQPMADLQEDVVCVVETNIDDSTPEMLGAVMDRLLEKGALDVYFTPIQMKKNRPATKLSVIAPIPLRAQLAQMVLEQTTSLGVRVYETSRLISQRWQETIESPWGPVRVKVKSFGGQRSARPEYDDCLRIAREQNIPIIEVYEAVRLALTSLYS